MIPVPFFTLTLTLPLRERERFVRISKGDTGGFKALWLVACGLWLDLIILLLILFRVTSRFSVLF